MSLNAKKEKLSNDIFRDVIMKKNRINVSTYQICLDLKVEEELVSNYFLGKTKENLVLGIEILNYLEEKEKM